jgi:Protein of unknown function DUF262/Protein of unknown function (DUF1524)
MSKIIHAEQLSLSKVFSDRHSFFVPQFQRPYSWGEEQISELLDDVEDAMQTDGDDRGYFLGSVVLMQRNETQFDIIDGQQRLTTLTMIFCVLRDLIEDASQATSLHGMIFEPEKPILGVPEHYRIQLRARDHVHFLKHNLERGATKRDCAEATTDEVHNRIIENRDYIRTRFEKLSPQQRFALCQFLATQCSLVLVTAKDQSSALRIFSVLNSRGLELSAADLVKADVLAGVPSDEETHYTGAWEHIEGAFGRREFGILLGHIHSIIADKPRDLVEDTKKYIKAETAKAFMDGVVSPAAQIYQKIRQQSFGDGPHLRDANRRLTHLTHLKQNDWTSPLLLWLSERAKQTDELDIFMRALERMAFVFTVGRQGKSHRKTRYQQLINAISNNRPISDVVKIAEISGKEQADVARNLMGPFFQTFGHGKLGTSILMRIEDIISPGRASVDFNTVMIEQVLPRDPVPGSGWAASFTDRTQRATYSESIGNLVLIDKKRSSLMRDFDFERKKLQYFAKSGSHQFSLTAEVLAESAWTPATVTSRQGRLILAFANEFGIDKRHFETASLRRFAQALRAA